MNSALQFVLLRKNGSLSFWPPASAMPVLSAVALFVVAYGVSLKCQ
jgi:hypothetical protein